MGRHSAPDDAAAEASGGDTAGGTGYPAESAPFATYGSAEIAWVPMGRHTSEDAEAEADTGELDIIAFEPVPETDQDAGTDTAHPDVRGEDAGPDGPNGKPAADIDAGHAPSRRSSGTRADLQLLRDSPRVRIYCAAGVIAPFLIYTVLIMLLGRADVYLIWLWIPIVSAGVVVGAFLDMAHHKRERAT